MSNNINLTYRLIDREKRNIFHVFLFRQIHLLLEQHAVVIHQGKKKPFNTTDVKLSEDVLEDIKGLFN
jgi:hypothetical protein